MSCFDIADAPAKPLTLVVAGLLVDTDGRILVQQRPKTKSFPDHWEFPGGKIEKNETPESALLRELKEELSIDTHQACLAPVAFASHAYDDFHLLMPVFILRQWRGIITPKPRSVADIKWLYLPQLAKLEKLLPADKPLIQMLHQFI
ncbi:MAG: (deoxy)nucleoside triphosphate pyrophosphohydrolase [Alphaproteobacteria bacterium]